MINEPVHLEAALGAFDALWSPRIITHVNNYDVRIAKIAGEFVWHTHDDTDEFFLVLEGELSIALRGETGERLVELPRGSVFVVPRGVEHKPFSAGGASILLFEPTGTSNVGNRHDQVPGHIAPSTGIRADQA